jgi:hypothetical protein
MAKFVVVKESPKELGKGEIVISDPDFMDQIVENSRKAPRLKQTGINHLREVLQAVGLKYDPELNVYKMRLVHFEGLPYNDDKDLSQIIIRILRSEHPQIFEKYLDYQLSHRPTNTKLVWYTGSFTSTAPFFRAGFDLLDEKDAEAFLTGKPKKTVGKPAITKEEAETREPNT